MTSHGTWSLAVFVLSVAIAGLAHGQGGPARSTPGGTVTENEIVEAFTALQDADGYNSIVQAVTQHERVIASEQMLALVNDRLENAALDENTRGLVLLVRQLSLDCRKSGSQSAARLMAVRLVASYALSADTPQQFATILEQFSPLEEEMSPTVVRDALDTPGNTWPAGLLPLMQQLATDWPQKGALAAATAMAGGARSGGTAGGGNTGGGSAGGTTGPVARRADQPLVGHWRSTRIVFEMAKDEHLVLHADGRAETWIVTAFERSGARTGRWTGQGSSLRVAWTDGDEWSWPYTFFEAQLVFPNVPNQRQFWERID